MLIDYDEIVLTVQELILGTGREVTFQKLGTAAADADKPWKGPGTPTVQASSDQPATFIPASGAGLGRELGVDDGRLKRVEQVCLVAPADGLDMEQFDTVSDGGATYGIDWVHALKPGATVLLWVVGVKQ